MKKIFLHFTDFFKITQKNPINWKKQYVRLFLPLFNAQICSCCSKISKRFTRESQMGTRESQNGHSGPLKSLTSFVISKLALLPILRLPLAHLRLPHEPFLKFSWQQEKIFSSKKGKKNVQITFSFTIFLFGCEKTDLKYEWKFYSVHKW